MVKHMLAKNSIFKAILSMVGSNATLETTGVDHN